MAKAFTLNEIDVDWTWIEVRGDAPPPPPPPPQRPIASTFTVL